MDVLTSSDPRTAGPYSLVARLGAGGMGRVYLGRSPAAERVAVKMIKPELISGERIRERFASEVDNLRTVYGARVARFEGADLMAERPWLASEYVAGLTLRRFVEERGPLEVTLAAILGAALAEGLGKIHEAGMLHRDFKPQNIVLGPDGPKIIDFGLAVLVDRDVQLTEAGMVVGTLAYMPPEQARGEKDLTPAADVYALGATIAHALTGLPLYATAGAALLSRIVDADDPPDLGGLPPGLRPLLSAMLAHEPQARPTLAAVAARLVQVATGANLSAAELRRRLADQTYFEPHEPPLPADLQDPVVEDDPVPGDDVGGEADAAGTEPEPVRGKSESTTAAGRGQEDRLPLPTGRQAPADVGWLVGGLRGEYDRHARF